MVQKYHGGNLRQASQLFGLAEEKFLDFSANINPLGPSPKIWPALQEAMKSITHYPDPEALDLKAGLAAYLGVPQSQVLLGNGGAELIYLVGHFFNPQRVVLTAPTFGEYGQGMIDTEIRRIKLEPGQNFQLDVSQFREILQPGDLVFIGNPNNPTGVLTPKEMVLELASLAATRRATLVVDEAFMDFVQDSQSIVGETEKYPQLIVVGSLTKIFALPGLRLGYLVAEDSIVKRLESLLPPWRINTLAQVAGLISLKDEKHLEASKEFVRVERKFLSQGLERLGFRPYPGVVNFILVDGRTLGIRAKELQQYLGPKGLLIRLCHSFYNLDDYFFRIAVRTREENEKLLYLLGEVLALKG